MEYHSASGIGEFARQAAIQEAEGYMNRELGPEFIRGSKTRIEEIMEYARRINYRRLGMAFCLGLLQEAKVMKKILSSGVFEVVSAACKFGGIS